MVLDRGRCAQHILHMPWPLLNAGVVLSSGHGSTAAVPVYEGHSLNHGLVKAGATGEELTEYMGQLLRESSLPTNIQGLDVSAVKAAVCYVAKDYDKEFLRQRCCCRPPPPQQSPGMRLA